MKMLSLIPVQSCKAVVVVRWLNSEIFKINANSSITTPVWVYSFQTILTQYIVNTKILCRIKNSCEKLKKLDLPFT